MPPQLMRIALAISACAVLVLAGRALYPAASDTSAAALDTPRASVTMTATPSSSAGSSAPAEAPTTSPAPASTFTPPNHHVDAAHQLKLSASDVSRDAAGQFFVPNRGDGCSYLEIKRGMIDGALSAVLQDVGCDIFFIYDITTGTLTAWVA